MPAADLSPTQPDQKTADLPSVPPDKILVIALGIVAIFGAIEIAGVAVHYISRARDQYAASHPAAQSPAAAPKTNAAPVEGTKAAVAPAPAQTQTNSLPDNSNTLVSVAQRLINEANDLRDKGDTTSALARLQDAAQREPKNAEVLATMAMIYESIELNERSNETWRKIEEIGPSAGAYYELAETKLKGATSTQPTTTTGAGLAGVAPLDSGSNRSDANGIPDGATFGITEVRTTDTPDPDAETNMKLKIAVKARPNTAIDHTKVKIQVFFYDMLDNKDIILTDADVSYEWLTPHHDWKDTDTEVLSVTYLRTKKSISPDAALSAAASQVTPPGGKKKGAVKKEPAAADAAAEEGHRKYYGYIVRIYYNDQLQSVRADPTKLLNSFPPPSTAPQ